MTDNDLTTTDLTRIFQVTAMTVHNWRKGSPQRPALPVSAHGRRIGFKRSIVRSWAKKAGVEIINEAAFNEVAIRAKPGPKPVPKIAVKV